jgi:D-tyrosyl-tRNA(Tyr) deacylase
MIALIQRVSEAKVVVNNKNIAEIQQGVLAFVGIEKDDSTIQASRRR